jgi:hypothetical protein
MSGSLSEDRVAGSHIAPDHAGQVIAGLSQLVGQSQGPFPQFTGTILLRFGPRIAGEGNAEQHDQGHRRQHAA